MPAKKEPTRFNAITVPLQGSNLIEASAGTGKTYSIAILTLRLILEKNFTVSEILMVTFTRAAVAELETRIRSFIRLAENYSRGLPIQDDTIRTIVDAAAKQLGEDEIKKRLGSAVLCLDETAILTIHSFCQRTLGEFAFETGQLFGAENMSPDLASELMEKQLQQFWRTHITTLSVELLKEVTNEGLSLSLMKKIIEAASAGKELVKRSAYRPDFLEPRQQEALLQQVKGKKADADKLFQQAIAYTEEHADELIDRLKKNQFGKKGWPDKFDDIPALLKEVYAKRIAQYIQAIFAEVLLLLEAAEKSKQDATTLLREFLNHIFQFAIDTTVQNINRYKEENGLLSFDDMITRLHEAVFIRQQPSLLAALRHKYKVAFIDEFQDTDKLQYEIFHTLFARRNILFYIGDPKQSIYGWRKADIFTYFKAAAAVENRYSMNTNYRSSDRIIEGLNHFFKPNEDFDTFHYQGAPDAIEYVEVEAPDNNQKGTLQWSGKEVTPISIFTEKNKSNISYSVAATIIQLLSNKEYQIATKEKSRSLKPSDIGILVRNKKNGKQIREILSYYKIPAVTIDETHILETDEALEVGHIMEAALEINTGTIHKALFSSLTGYSINDILTLNEELALNRFKDYQQAWEKNGIYVMLMKFITDYRVKTHLLQPTTPNGDRKLSNLMQLLELLHKTQVSKKYAPEELLNWLKRGRDKNTTEGDEFEQRVESDEEAVKILTIHKSKGLEYNIVLAPDLDMLPEQKNAETYSYRQDPTGEYCFILKPDVDDATRAIIIQQQEQENRRLLYVALTRAKYKCYIYSNSWSGANNSTLKAFLNEIQKNIPDTITMETVAIPDPQYRYTDQREQFPIEYKKAEVFQLRKVNWRKMSYSYLNPEHAVLSNKTTEAISNDYDRFVFLELKKGAHTGNLLHFIFENIDFSSPTGWSAVIARALKIYAPAADATLAAKLQSMIEEIVQCPITIGEQRFCLQQVSRRHRLNELEFDFPVQPFATRALQEWQTSETPLQVRNHEELEGVMNGKIDLFFEYGGRYYILDWKSNHLGNSLSQYQHGRVHEAMTDNNYHLQYHIYTIAAYQYLSLRVPGFDYTRDFGGVIYGFVRGMRKNSDTGLFVYKIEEPRLRQLMKVILPQLSEAKS